MFSGTDMSMSYFMIIVDVCVGSDASSNGRVLYIMYTNCYAVTRSKYNVRRQDITTPEYFES